MNDQQARFVEEYLKDLNATRAAKRAGYSENRAMQTGHDLVRHREVAAAITEAIEKRSERTQITQDWVIDKLVTNVERAMTAEPVLDREGNPVGEYTYQGAVANKSLELLGKHVGLFSDRLEVSGRVEVDNPDVAVAIERFTAAVVSLSRRAGTERPVGELAAGSEGAARLSVARVAGSS